MAPRFVRFPLRLNPFLKHALAFDCREKLSAAYGMGVQFSLLRIHREARTKGDAYDHTCAEQGCSSGMFPLIAAPSPFLVVLY